MPLYIVLNNTTDRKTLPVLVSTNAPCSFLREADTASLKPLSSFTFPIPSPPATEKHIARGGASVIVFVSVRPMRRHTNPSTTSSQPLPTPDPHQHRYSVVPPLVL